MTVGHTYGEMVGSLQRKYTIILWAPLNCIQHLCGYENLLVSPSIKFSSGYFHKID
jgi:hypothetical protein